MLKTVREKFTGWKDKTHKTMQRVREWFSRKNKNSKKEKPIDAYRDSPQKTVLSGVLKPFRTRHVANRANTEWRPKPAATRYQFDKGEMPRTEQQQLSLYDMKTHEHKTFDPETGKFVVQEAPRTPEWVKLMRAGKRSRKR